MIKNKSEMPIKREIDLSGPQGNAFCLLGYAKSFCQQLGRDFAPINKEMTNGDYDHLVEVFDREFGDFVTLYKADDIEDENDEDDEDIEDDYDEDEDGLDDEEEI